MSHLAGRRAGVEACLLRTVSSAENRQEMAGTRKVSVFCISSGHDSIGRSSRRLPGQCCPEASPCAVRRVGSSEELFCQGAGCPAQYEDQVDQVSTSKLNPAFGAQMPFGGGEQSFSFIHLDQEPTPLWKPEAQHRALPVAVQRGRTARVYRLPGSHTAGNTLHSRRK